MSPQHYSEPSELSPTVHFSIAAENSPGTLPRILELFALRGITPEQVKCHKYNQGNLSIDVFIKGLSHQEQAVILQKIAAQVLVFSVKQENLLSLSYGRLAS